MSESMHHLASAAANNCVPMPRGCRLGYPEHDLTSWHVGKPVAPPARKGWLVPDALIRRCHRETLAAVLRLGTPGRTPWTLRRLRPSRYRDRVFSVAGRMPGW